MKKLNTARIDSYNYAERVQYERNNTGAQFNVELFVKDIKPVFCLNFLVAFIFNYYRSFTYKLRSRICIENI